MKKIILIAIVILQVVFAQAQLRIMSFNIRFNNPKDTAHTSWQMRKEPCADMIHVLSPDVIGMQEPRGDIQINDIKVSLPDYTSIEMQVPEGWNVDKTGRIMMFFKTDKFSLLKQGQFWLNEDVSTPGVSFGSTDTGNIRGVQWIKLRETGSKKVFYLVNTHFPYKKDSVDDVSRAKCAELIVKQMKKIAGKKATVFVTGDMNASFDLSDKHRNSLTPFYSWFWSARDMAPKTDNKSSFNGFASQSYVWPHNIDHIYYRNAAPQYFETHDKSTYGVPFLSDHFPIICDFIY